MILKEADPIQRANAEATGLYKLFNQNMVLLRETTDPVARKMWAQDLEELCLRAQQLLSSGALLSIQHSQMTIITSRPAAEWVILCRNNAALVPTH